MCHHVAVGCTAHLELGLRIFGAKSFRRWMTEVLEYLRIQKYDRLPYRVLNCVRGMRCAISATGSV